MNKTLKSALIGSVSSIALATAAHAEKFNIPGGDLETALNSFTTQTGVALIVSDTAVRGAHTKGAHGDLSADVALSRILDGTGFTTHRTPSGAVGVVREKAKAKRKSEAIDVEPVQLAATQHAARAVETVVVTSSKIKGDIQTIPIAITALSQEQLTTRQIAGGPDLVKEVPNLTFSKTNFTGYNIQIRGIGTQAISVATDPAVAVAFNDIPFLRNHFFEQEFFDVAQVEVVRGPQGTLYGRNATAGVVNVISAKPTDHFEAMLSADWGNYSNRRYEGMVNIPIAGDKLMLRVAGEWTKRDGYTYNESQGSQVDGRDLWSGRVSLRWRPTEDITTDFIWEHFQENDDRLRSGKQLCKKDEGPTSIDGTDLTDPALVGTSRPDYYAAFAKAWLSQGCLPTSLYSKDAFETPNGQVLPFIALGEFIAGNGSGPNGGLLNQIDPYASQAQPRDLRTIQSLIDPHYRARNDTLEFNVNYQITPSLTLTSQTGWNKDFLWSTEDLNRFDTTPGLFNGGFDGLYGAPSPIYPDGTYCDPQLGCSAAMVGQDLSREHAWQFNQEIRLASDFKGPFNFSLGANYLHYQTNEDYFVFFNAITLISQLGQRQGPGDYATCHPSPTNTASFIIPPEPIRIRMSPTFGSQITGVDGVFSCSNINVANRWQGVYIDPNPIPSINGQGHNYFRSENPYHVSSYAVFGEAYYQLTPDLKLTGGLRWTDDQKTFWEIPSWTYLTGGGYPVESVLYQEWKEFTGRGVVTWTPKLGFTDQTMIYASYSRGYKGGGANPPLPEQEFTSSVRSSTHPATFDPEFVNAYELGTKNTLLDGDLILNADAFYYDYKGYQISQIVDRTSVNLNVDAHIWGAELQADYSPLPGLKFSFNGGYENTRINDGQSVIDLMDRTAGQPGWVVLKPFPTTPSNCIMPAEVVKEILTRQHAPDIFGRGLSGVCGYAYSTGGLAHVYPNSQVDAAFAATGFDPSTAPNNGEGFTKPLGGNQLPNAPHFTASLAADYTMPVSPNWAATLHTDLYWQSQSWWRIFNDKQYDKLRGYSNVNLALILTDASGWQVMGYVKNVFDTTAITGAFLFSDDTALTTNIFTTDPRLYGVRLTKNFEAGDGGFDLFSGKDGTRPPLWVTLEGQYAMQKTGLEPYNPAFYASTATRFNPSDPSSPLPPFGTDLSIEQAKKEMWNRGAEISFQPEGSDWILSASIRYGKIGRKGGKDQHNPISALATKYSYNAYQHPTFQVSESHTIMDFGVGMDVGLGRFGKDASSVVGAGVRIAQFDSLSSGMIKSQPTSGHVAYYKFYGAFDAVRKFNGIGPSLSWKASSMVMGERSDGGISVDWGVNGALLFGRQKTAEHHQTTKDLWNPPPGGLQITNVYQTSDSHTRSRDVTVPNLGGFAAVTWNYADAKISMGYRADFFFNAIDGGIDARKSENRGFYGPYLNLSIGFGG